MYREREREREVCKSLGNLPRSLIWLTLHLPCNNYPLMEQGICIRHAAMSARLPSLLQQSWSYLVLNCTDLHSALTIPTNTYSPSTTYRLSLFSRHCWCNCQCVQLQGSGFDSHLDYFVFPSIDKANSEMALHYRSRHD